MQHEDNETFTRKLATKLVNHSWGTILNTLKDKPFTRQPDGTKAACKRLADSWTKFNDNDDCDSSMSCQIVSRRYGPMPKLQCHTMWLSDGDEDSSVLARRHTRKTTHSDVGSTTAEGELNSRTLPVRVISPKSSHTLNIASKRRIIRPHKPHSNLTLLQYVDLTTRPQLITHRQHPSSWLVHVSVTCHRNR